ncbi:Uncharacterised protein [Candidatus Bilamarchaeum dharawalense]|uniref:Uncharacterized protein n=1 Tax=Candidatus Bilamarchaeum dharawalense TaxID=2885759 RepID=A0A5E4LP53_9ARCH|nr:Uncharacterised protein [Candidatus Bilamarchaeum dharawalense]
MITTGNIRVLKCAFATASTDPVTKVNGPSDPCKKRGCTGFHTTIPSCETFISVESLRGPRSSESKA